MVFALVIALLLAIPFVQVIGGVLLFWIAWQPVRGGEADEEKVRAGRSVWDAAKVIVAAEAVIPLDNVIALVGVSGGNLWLIKIGLAPAVPLVVWGATLLSALLDRWPILVYAGAGLLAWVALGMIFEGEAVHGILAGLPNGFEPGGKLAGTGIFVAFVWLWPFGKYSERSGSR